jgi:hypothetical protein
VRDTSYAGGTAKCSRAVPDRRPSTGDRGVDERHATVGGRRGEAFDSRRRHGREHGDAGARCGAFERSAFSADRGDALIVGLHADEDDVTAFRELGGGAGRNRADRDCALDRFGLHVEHEGLITGCDEPVRQRGNSALTLPPSLIISAMCSPRSDLTPWRNGAHGGRCSPALTRWPSLMG